MMRVRSLACALALTACAGRAFGDDADRRPEPTIDLAPVQVGVKSPPLWRFHRGQKQLIILGTQDPLPTSGVLVTDSISHYIARSGAVLTGPGLRTGDGVGFLRGLMLISSLRKARQNAHGRPLIEVLPPSTYDRWQQLKAKYLGKNSAVEQQRPMYAAYELYISALKRNGLSDGPMIGSIIVRAAKQAGLKRIDARYGLPDQNFRDAIKAFNVPLRDDVACLQRTLDTLESYIGYSPAAAEAWAAGDVRRYRDVEQKYQPIEECWARLTNEALARSAGINDPYARVDPTWLAAVLQALAQHDVVFSTLPARDLIEGRGLAARLRDEGFIATELFSE